MEIEPKICVDKKTLRNVIYTLLEGKKKTELEQLEINISSKDIPRSSPAKLPEILQEIYFKTTGRTVTKVLKQPYVEVVSRLDSTKKTHFRKIPSRENFNAHIKNGETAIRVFDAVCIVAVDENKRPKADVLKKRFNIDNIIKTNQNKRTK